MGESMGLRKMTLGELKGFHIKHSRIGRLESEQRRILRVLSSSGLNEQMRRVATALLDATNSELSRLREETERY